MESFWLHGGIFHLPQSLPPSLLQLATECPREEQNTCVQQKQIILHRTLLKTNCTYAIKWPDHWKNGVILTWKVESLKELKFHSEFRVIENQLVYFFPSIDLLFSISLFIFFPQFIYFFPWVDLHFFPSVDSLFYPLVDLLFYPSVGSLFSISLPLLPTTFSTVHFALSSLHASWFLI